VVNKSPKTSSEVYISFRNQHKQVDTVAAIFEVYIPLLAHLFQVDDIQQSPSLFSSH
jgi:hypothetical protein